MPRSFPFGAARQALLERIATHGIVERLDSDVDDDSRGASIDSRPVVKFGLGGKKLAVHRTLIRGDRPARRAHREAARLRPSAG